MGPFWVPYGGLLRFRDRGAAHELRRTDRGIGGLEALAFGEDRPEDSRVLVADGHQRSITAPFALLSLSTLPLGQQALIACSRHHPLTRSGLSDVAHALQMIML